MIEHSPLSTLRRRLGFGVAVTNVWILMILLGAVLLETFMVYPNIFADPPRTLGLALEFFEVVAPSDFFPPLGFAAWSAGVAAMVLCWDVLPARRWIAMSFALLLADGLVSIFVHWPRNTIMFVEGPVVHSAGFLVQTAEEFERLHWSRVFFTASAALAMFVALLRVHAELLSRRHS